MTRPLRVLHIDTEKGWRGGEQQALFLAEGLRRRGVENLCVGQPDLPYVQRCAAKGLDVAPVRTRGEADPAGVAKIRSIVRSWRPDVVHMHTSHAHTLGVLVVLRERPFDADRAPLALEAERAEVALALGAEGYDLDGLAAFEGCNLNAVAGVELEGGGATGLQHIALNSRFEGGLSRHDEARAFGRR